jgi:hypothetical protein
LTTAGGNSQRLKFGETGGLLSVLTRLGGADLYRAITTARLLKSDRSRSLAIVAACSAAVTAKEQEKRFPEKRKLSQ